MHLKHVAILLLMQCAVAQERKLATLSDLVADCPRVKFYNHPADKGLVAAYRERDPEWSGHMTVCHHSGGKIDWEAKFPGMYEEWKGHYVVSCDWITLPQVEAPVLELIESTHRGNGSLFLFELEGREFRLLLHTKVRGQLFDDLEVFGVPRHGEAYIKGDHLHMEYRVADDQKSRMILLTGTIEISDMEGRAQPPKKYEQKCLWDEEKRVFIASDPTSP